MKKIRTLALAVLLVCTVSLPVTAKDINQDSSSQNTDIDISTKIEPTYMVTIPENVSVDFKETSTAFGAVRLKQAQIEPDKCVKVSLTASGTLKNQKDAQKTIAYTICDKDNNPFTSAQYLAAGEETALNIVIEQSAWDAAFAGDYADTVTFSVSYENTAP